MMSRRPIRVVYFRNARGISDVTGAESYAFSLLQALDASEVQGRLVAAVRPGSARSPWVIEAQRRNVALQLVEVDSKFGLQDYACLREQIRSMGADVVHTLDHRADVVGMLAARREGCALVNAFFGWTNFSGRYSRGALYAWLDRHAQARADAVITDSGYMAGMLGAGGRGPSVVVVHNGVDIARFRPDAAVADLRPRFFGRSDVLVFGVVGRVHPNKGQLDFLKAAREIGQRCPQARFLILGDAPPGWETYRAEVARTIVELGLADRAVLTNVASAEIPAVLASIDVLVSPSYAESFSYSLLEAMSMRRPIICTDVGGNREMMVDGESGVIIAPGDVHALVREALKLSEDASARERLGEAARRRVEQRFTLERMARRTTDIYREVLEARAQGLARHEIRARVQRHGSLPASAAR